ncbi:MAG TPA: uracil-DNA glycosylase, partial [Campylobacterales bacterium]|nr:uracil-DNA glycosylase [Campylobacterales bacterium]
MKNSIKLEPSWLAVLQDEFEKPYMQRLKEFLVHEKNMDKKILPKASLWFNA